MPTNVRKATLAGIARALYWNLDSDGIALGTQTTIADDDEIVLGRLLGIKSAELPIPEGNTVPATGDNGVIHEFIFPPNESPKGTIQVSVKDLDFEADAQGTKVFTEGNWDMGAMFPADLVFSNKGLLLTTVAASQDTGSAGLEGFWNYIIPLATINPQGESGLSEQNALTPQYQLVINRAERLPYGRPMTDADHGTTKAGYIAFWTEGLWTMEIFQGAGTPKATLPLTATPAGIETTGKVAAFLWDGTTFTKKVATTDFTVGIGPDQINLLAGDELATGEIMVVAFEEA